MATISDYRASGLTLPTWFLSIATASFLSVSGLVIIAGIGTWQRSIDNERELGRQEQRLERLELAVSGIAVMQHDLSETRDLARGTNDTLSRLLEGYARDQLRKRK